MTDTKALRDRILLSGLKYKAIAEQIGITPYTLQLKIENDTEFKVSEVDKLSSLLDLSLQEKDQIFFCKIVELNSTPAPLPLRMDAIIAIAIIWIVGVCSIPAMRKIDKELVPFQTGWALFVCAVCTVWLAYYASVR